MTDSRDPVRDPYKVLQVDAEAELDVIQAAYRRLAQKYHPDRTAHADPDEARASAARMAAINEAWALLRDPARRAAHDRDRGQRGQGGVAATTGPATPAEERWQPGTRDRWRPNRPARSAPTGSDGRTSEAAPDRRSARAGEPGGDVFDPNSPGVSSVGGDVHAGPPPGRPSGSVLTFGRYAGWSLGEIGRSDPGYLEWLDRMPIGRTYRDELDGMLRRLGRRQTEPEEAANRRGLFRRR